MTVGKLSVNQMAGYTKQGINAMTELGGSQSPESALASLAMCFEMYINGHATKEQSELAIARARDTVAKTTGTAPETASEAVNGWLEIMSTIRQPETLSSKDANAPQT